MIKCVLKYMLLFCYFTIGFFILGLVVKVVISFIHLGAFYLPYDEIIRNFFKSTIAGSAITSAAIIFNLIDKFKAGKNPPSDPQ